jgi:hypothetical protein
MITFEISKYYSDGFFNGLVWVNRDGKERLYILTESSFERIKKLDNIHLIIR